MPFPDLNIGSVNLGAPTRNAGVPLASNAVFTGTTNWSDFTRVFRTGPKTSAIWMYWVEGWNNGSEIAIYDCQFWPIIAGSFRGPVVPGANYTLGPATTDLGAFTDPLGGGNARQLRSLGPSHTYLSQAALIPVLPNSVYTATVTLRRTAFATTQGTALTFDEYPGFAAAEDSQYFRDQPTDPAVRKEFDGGFTMTRPRFTRIPPRRFTTGFTDISDADKKLFFDYVAAQRGGAGSFTYTNPVSAEQLTMRFQEMPEAAYAGIGGHHRWNIPSIKLEQV